MRLAAASQRPQRLTPGLFFPPAEPRRLQTNFIYAAHFTPEGSTKGFTDDTDEKKAQLKYKKAGREMQIDDKPTNTFHIKEKKRTLAWI